MEILTDLHCHTLASTHAYSTLQELMEAAQARGLEAVAVTDHGIALPDAPHLWHFINMACLPEAMYGVRLLRGCEVNILDADGHIDMPEEVLQKLDIVVASIHTPAFSGGDAGADQTNAYLGALENPYVDIIGHSGNPKYPYDYDSVLLKAKQLHKLIEINAHTFLARPQNVENCRNIALRCKELGVGITVDSDAHFSGKVGAYGPAAAMLSEIGFPEELIMNRSLSVLRAYLKGRKTIN